MSKSIYSHQQQKNDCKAVADKLGIVSHSCIVMKPSGTKQERNKLKYVDIDKNFDELLSYYKYANGNIDLVEKSDVLQFLQSDNLHNQGSNGICICDNLRRNMKNKISSRSKNKSGTEDLVTMNTAKKRSPADTFDIQFFQCMESQKRYRKYSDLSTRRKSDRIKEMMLLLMSAADPKVNRYKKIKNFIVNVAI